jgi:predicted RNA-binding protein YlqC (UPF0109 family)
VSDTAGGSPFAEPDFSGVEMVEDDESFDDDDESFDEADETDEVDEADEADEFDPNAADGDEGANSIDGGVPKAVLEYLATAIVDEKDAVVVEVRESRGQARLDLHVAPSDMGRIIGRRGRTAQAVRAIVRAAAAGEGRDVVVDIVD